MATEKQIVANSQNALKGGVKTEDGKQISKLNSLKHGLTSHIVMNFDDQKDYIAFSDELVSVLTPKDVIEKLLIERIVFNYIRLMRVSKIEANLIDSNVNSTITKKIYIDKEAGEEYKKQLATFSRMMDDIAEKRQQSLMDTLRTSIDQFELDKLAPQEPKYKLERIEGVYRCLSSEAIEELADLVNRYYISAENRFYRALREFWDYHKQNGFVSQKMPCESPNDEL